jgi:hypothetical protein
MKKLFLDVCQYLDTMVEKFFKPHVCWPVSQSKPSNDLVSKVSTLGNGFEVVLQAPLEVLLSPLVSFEWVATKVQFCDWHTLKAAAKKIVLLVHVLRVIL